MRDFLAFFKSTFENTKVTFEEDYDPDVPELSLEAEGIQQLLYNLAKNAIEARPNNHIILRTRAFPDKKLVKLTITDAGSGIDRQKVDQIFFPLFTDKENAHGMGLANCQAIAKIHGGSISVESKLNEGATITVELPINSDVKS